MKILVFISMTLCFISGLNAQEKDIDKKFKQGFELTVSYGAIASITDLFENDNYDPSFDPGNLSDTYHRTTISTGAFNIGGTYRIKKWFETGLTLSYSARIKRFAYKTNDVIKRNETRHRISLIPEARFVWFNARTGVVKLYSSVGIGIGLALDPDRYSGCTIKPPEKILTGKFIPIGIKVGAGKFYGFGEVGVATTGFVAMGAGYRFNR